MTRVQYEPERYYMRVEGHAQAVEPGQIDPVCAGVSALAFTLVAAADDTPEYHMQVYLNPAGGVVDVQCFPEDGFEDHCRYMFDIIYNGLRLIESEFAAYVKTGGAEDG